jgi:hypothetical protein
MNDYGHVVIDKAGIGLDALRQQVAGNGLQTAQQRGIPLAPGSIKFEHHLHVFVWDGSDHGIRGRRGIEAAGNCFLVRVRWPRLTESGSFLPGSLKGDSMQNGPPSGRSTNGAWAFKGPIPRRYCFIEGLDAPDHPGFDDWREGRGWP